MPKIQHVKGKPLVAKLSVPARVICVFEKEGAMCEVSADDAKLLKSYGYKEAGGGNSQPTKADIANELMAMEVFFEPSATKAELAELLAQAKKQLD